MMELARVLDAIPVVTNAAERAVRFPSPAPYQRVHNLETEVLEMWVGSGWVTVLQLGTTTPALESLTVTDGTLAAPSVAFVGATGTGLYRTAGGNLALVHAGVLVGYFGAGGFVCFDAAIDNIVIQSGGTFTYSGGAAGFLVDLDGAGVQEVTYGANDSGGTGSRALVVPNTP